MAQPKYRIATIGSHSALQIFKGAHDEGFKTIAVCKKGSERPYKMFNAADEIISINSYKDFPGMHPDVSAPPGKSFNMMKDERAHMKNFLEHVSLHFDKK